MRRADRREPPRRVEHHRVGGVLDPQLHDLDAAAQRLIEEPFSSAVADQVQPRVLEPFVTVVHMGSVARLPRYDRRPEHLGHSSFSLI